MEFSLRVPEIEDWYYRELLRLYETPPTRSAGFSVVMGCPVWGREFVREFLNWGVPSIFEGESGKALAGCCRLVVFAGADDRLPLLRSLRVLEGGIDIQIIEIPDKLIEQTRTIPQNKLFLLSAVHKLVLQIARRCGAGFSMLMPDHFHCAGFFARGRDLSTRHDAIAQCSISVAREPAQKILEAHRNADGSFSISPLALGDVAMSCMHPHHRANVMTPDSVPNSMPRTPLMLWRTKDRLVAHSCRPNPVWLAPHLVAALPCDFERPSTLDCEMPFLAPRGAYYTKAGDGMTAVEFTSINAKEIEPGRVPMGEYAPKALTESRYSDRFLDLIRHRTEMPLSETTEPVMTDEEIRRDVESVIDELRQRRAGVAVNFMQRLVAAPESFGL